MSWAKFDDRFWSNRKVRAAWRANRASVGLYVMGVTYSAMHELDGHVDQGFVDDQLPAKEAVRAVRALIDAGLWERSDGGYVIHDYLDFNESAEVKQGKRDRDSERKARGNHNRGRGTPTGFRAESGGNPPGIQDVSARPDPTRPDLLLPLDPPPSGGRNRDRERWVTAAIAWVNSTGVVEGSDDELLRLVEQAKPWEHDDPAGHLRAFSSAHWPQLARGVRDAA